MFEGQLLVPKKKKKKDYKWTGGFWLMPWCHLQKLMRSSVAGPGVTFMNLKYFAVYGVSHISCMRRGQWALNTWCMYMYVLYYVPWPIRISKVILYLIIEFIAKEFLKSSVTHSIHRSQATSVLCWLTKCQEYKDLPL